MPHPAPLSEVALRGLHGARWVLGCASYFVLLPALAYGYVFLNPPPAVLPPVLLAIWILPVSFVNISQRGLIGRVCIGRRFLNLLVLSCALVAALLFWFCAARVRRRRADRDAAAGRDPGDPGGAGAGGAVRAWRSADRRADPALLLLPRFLSSFPIGVNLPGGVRLGI